MIASDPGRTIIYEAELKDEILFVEAPYTSLSQEIIGVGAFNLASEEISFTGEDTPMRNLMDQLIDAIEKEISISLERSSNKPYELPVRLNDFHLKGDLLLLTWYMVDGIAECHRLESYETCTGGIVLFDVQDVHEPKLIKILLIGNPIYKVVDLDDSYRLLLESENEKVDIPRFLTIDLVPHLDRIQPEVPSITVVTAEPTPALTPPPPAKDQ